MTITELRKELEALETEGKGKFPVTVRVNADDGEYEYVEASTVRTLRADANHAPDFDKDQSIVLVE